MNNILLIAVRLGLEAAVWRGSEKHVLQEKTWKIPTEKFIFQLGRSLQACNVDKNEFVTGYFSMIFIVYFS